LTNQEERYLHFVQCIRNFNNSWIILQQLKEGKGNPSIINAAFQFALIEYSKPYKYSRGALLSKKGKQKQYRLNSDYVPSMHRELHDRIIDARDQIYAHSDLSVLEAKVYVKKTPYGKIAGHVQNQIYGTEEFLNINAIIELVESTLDLMYEKEKILESELPVTT